MNNNFILQLNTVIIQVHQQQNPKRKVLTILFQLVKYPNSNRILSRQLRMIHLARLILHLKSHHQLIGHSRLPSDDSIWLDDDNSFLLFLSISILLAHRTHLLKQKRLDEQEIAMHFDRYRRRHNSERLLKYARTLYEQYLQSARKKRMLDDLSSFSAS